MSPGAGREPPAPGTYRAALYMRLSKDDDGTAESASIAAQRKMLRAYARENAYAIAGEYIDDGWSGTSFDRPDFNRMIADIEDRKINMVITKDLSRLGRDYITAGQYTELFFPGHGVRYIAVNDGYDSENPPNDIAPFKHVMNEMYARDASKKIRSALRTKMLEGSYIGNFAPYGYRKDPDNKNHLVPDCEAAAVVREIFRMAAAGGRPSEIAARLNERGVASPGVYRRLARPELSPDARGARGVWTASTVCRLLGNVVYLGHTAQGKTSKPSFKSKTARRKPPGEWYVVENTHEQLVTADVFERVQKRCVARRNAPKTGFQNVFSGVAKCADCGGNMSVTGSRKKGSPYNLVCARYKLHGSSACANHFIDYGLLYGAVLSETRKVLTLTEAEKQQVLAELARTDRGKRASAPARERARLLETLAARDRALDALLRRLYEDNVSGKISDERFAKLSAGYEAEQRQVGHRMALLEQPAAPPARDGDARPRRAALLDGLADLNALTPELVSRLIDHIEVEQGGYEQTPEGRKKRQTVRIFWRFGKDGSIN